MRKRDAWMLGLLAVLPVAAVQAQQTKAEAGKEIAINRNKGNCLACHGVPALAEADQTGNAGPPLIAMQARFPDKRVLRDKIWDATASNPGTFMPPFGKHGILTAEDIDQLVEFLYAL